MRAVVSYNRIDASSGRDVLVYSKVEYGQALLADIVESAANTIYVYMGGAGHMHAAEELIRGLKEAGKTVIMVACDCECARKRAFAKNLKIEWRLCGCGGGDVLPPLILGL